MKKKVTFKDIAKYTGFSKTTVSRYFNNPDSLTLENQEKIKKALDELGYEENKVGRILASGHSEFIGIVIPNLYFHYYAALLECLLSTYDQYGYKFIVFSASEHPELERKYLSELKAYNIEGLITLSHTISSYELKQLDLPVVGIEREADHISGVSCNNYEGARLAAKCLHEHQPDMLFHINVQVPENIPSYQRIEGFSTYCKEHDIPYEVRYLEMEKENYEGVRKGIKQLFDQIEEQYPNEKKGVFLSNDTYASIFLNLIHQKYGRLPDTYHLVGFDNSPVSEEAMIGITTIDQNIPELAHQAMELLIPLMEERKKRRPGHIEPEHAVVEPHLIRRQTA